MASGNMRGSRIGAGPMGESERGVVAPRTPVTFWCYNLHETQLSFADDPSVIVPTIIDCRRCGMPAGTDMDHPPAVPVTAPFKTHMAYVRERRTQTEGDALVDQALKALRGR